MALLAAVWASAAAACAAVKLAVAAVITALGAKVRIKLFKSLASLMAYKEVSAAFLERSAAL